jgi:membrane protease YdiL (CAAX protease family)
MKTQKMMLAAIAYIVVTFIIAAGWHLVLFKGLYDELGIFTRKEPLIHLGVISMILQGIVLAYVYPLGYQGGNPVKEGLRFGLLMGIFMGSNAVFAEAGKNVVSSLSTWLTLESVYYLLQFGLVGIVIGWIYGKDIASR